MLDILQIEKDLNEFNEQLGVAVPYKELDTLQENSTDTLQDSINSIVQDSKPDIKDGMDAPMQTAMPSRHMSPHGG